MRTYGHLGRRPREPCAVGRRAARPAGRTLRASCGSSGIAGILGFLVTWQLIPTLGIVNPRYFPTATDTLARLFAEFRDLEFWRNVGRT